MAGMMEDEATEPSVPMDPVPAAPAGDAGQVSTMRRDEPDPVAERKALVKQRLQEAKRAIARSKADIDRVRENIRFARGIGQWPGGGDSYVANITQRHVQQRTAALYAKNPKFVVKRRETMDFEIWDETQASLDAAMMMLQPPAPPPVGAGPGAGAGDNGGPPMEPEATAAPAPPPAPPADPAMLQMAAMLVQDVQRGLNKRRLYDNIARTSQIVLNQQLQAQDPPFKISMKGLVRRAITTSVGWLKIDFQREMGLPTPTRRAIADMEGELARLQAGLADLQDGMIDETAAQREEIRLQMEKLQKSDQVVLREGIVYEFLPTDAVRVDPKCRDLRRLVGAEYITEIAPLTVSKIKELYSVDLSKKVSGGDPQAEKWAKWGQGDDAEKNMDTGDKPINVYVIQHRPTGMVYTVAEGYDDFLCEPEPPNVKLTRFWQYIPLCFNELESDDKSTIYPPSDVDLLKPMQRDYNRSRQALREHRHANRPAYVTGPDGLEEEDKEMLKSRPNMAVIELAGLQPDEDIKKKIMALPAVPIDPALYDTTQGFQDIERVVGSQAAALGGLSDGATATEVSVSEGARMSSIGSNIDDLDDFLSEVAKASGEIAFAEFNLATVQKIVGIGAAWPQQTRQEIAESLVVEFEAGSSGRPNKAQEAQTFQQLAPILMQIPGIKPDWFARHAVKVLDDKVDPTDALLSGMPSMQQMTKDAPLSNDPAQQGAAGGDNAARQPAPNEAPQPRQPDQVDPAGGLPPRGPEISV